MAGTVWTTGCSSWYLDASGRNTTLWPGYVTGFRLRTRRFRPQDHAAAAAGSPVGMPVEMPVGSPVEMPVGSPVGSVGSPVRAPVRSER
jgi:hypothetical protein